MAALGDFYVNDAFSTAHRAHASTEGITHFLPSFAGRAMEAELKALERALGNPERPVAAVVGGAKVSTKLAVLGHLVGKVDHLIIGGGMANTFLAARGVNVGKSLCEHELTGEANAIFDRAEQAGCTIHLPYDVVVAKEFAPNPPSLRTCNVHEVAADEMILDVGPAAVEALADVLKTCRTLVWNGPLGAFETPPFDAATVALAKTAAALTKEGSLVSVAGGGDTVAALNHAGVAQDFSFVSTAGGAFLEWMEGRTLPGRRRARTATGEAMNQSEMTAKIEQGDGFIAALDQSGGSTPKALKGYGIEEGAWSSDEEMFGLIHQMRSRIITSPCFGSGKVHRRDPVRADDGRHGRRQADAAGADRQGVVPFIKIDKGLEDEENGVQMMKPMPELDALLERAKALGVFGTKERSVINAANPAGIAALVAQQFQVAQAGARPRHDADHRARGEHQERRPRRRATTCCSTAILEELDEHSRRPAGDAEAVDPGRGRPVRAAGRSSQGAARRRAVRRLLPRGSLPRAGEESRHDRELQPRAAVRPARAAERRGVRPHARRRRSTRSTRRRPTKVPA